ncbi:MAG TPA: ABC transporter substrate-binding protein [Hypericibacter adhaerens]|uniref:ABC polyamine/opine transporter substrate-binding protein n=1 Tax=Hypericibacter adhaerens TaxID=2602016 RepID=A0A5J6MWW7_9PROT|nr:ABC transporter substrate-binding protein [Hypericibacter adhaerens]QEX22222.1 ABC polyamine/opine transporter substrate-binding protein [Hypericibacter adhaerens]HWA43955.1 ABC transporter substrate-binding protein [Hypericibacter adhaerens]
MAPRLRTLLPALATAGSLLIATAASADSVTVVSYGGSYTQSQIEAYHKPFTAATGITVNSADYNGGVAEIKAQVEAGNVAWDVVDLELQDLQRACQSGYLEPVDVSTITPAPDGTPATEDYLPKALSECGVGNIAYSNVIAYDTTKFPGDKPNSIADFFDTKKFPGKRGLQKRGAAVSLEWALLADGVAPADVYKVLGTPAGVDRAFAKLDTIKKDVIWYDTGAQAPQLLADGQVVMTSAFNGRIYTAITDNKQPFAIIWNDQIWNINLWGIIKGTKHLEAARAYVKFATQSQNIANQTKYIAYGPLRKSSLALTSDTVRPWLPTYEKNLTHALQYDAEFWADHADELDQRFNAWLAK